MFTACVLEWKSSQLDHKQMPTDQNCEQICVFYCKMCFNIITYTEKKTKLLLCVEILDMSSNWRQLQQNGYNSVA